MEKTVVAGDSGHEWQAVKVGDGSPQPSLGIWVLTNAVKNYRQN